MVHVDAQKALYVNNIQVSEAEAVDRIKIALEEKAERVVYLKGDTDAPVQRHHEHDGQAARGGIENVALITESKKKAGEGGGD